MPLFNCPECSQKISTRAEKCIHCGYIIPKKVCSKCGKRSTVGIDECSECGYNESIARIEAEEFKKKEEERLIEVERLNAEQLIKRKVIIKKVSIILTIIVAVGLLFWGGFEWYTAFKFNSMIADGDKYFSEERYGDAKSCYIKAISYNNSLNNREIVSVRLKQLNIAIAKNEEQNFYKNTPKFDFKKIEKKYYFESINASDGSDREFTLVSLDILFPNQNRADEIVKGLQSEILNKGFGTDILTLDDESIYSWASSSGFGNQIDEEAFNEEIDKYYESTGFYPLRSYYVTTTIWPEPEILSKIYSIKVYRDESYWGQCRGNYGYYNRYINIDYLKLDMLTFNDIILCSKDEFVSYVKSTIYPSHMTDWELSEFKDWEEICEYLIFVSNKKVMVEVQIDDSKTELQLPEHLLSDRIKKLLK